MYSAGVNAALAQFFGIADIDNILQSSSNIPTVSGTIPNPLEGNIPNSATSNILAESIDVEALPGKLEAGDSGELPNVDNEVAEELQNDLSNLKVDNEWLRQKLAERQDSVETLNWGTEALNEQLATANQKVKALQAENQRLHIELDNLRDAFPDPADLLNELKAKRRKSTASLADIETILEILEGR
jgi:uncharacterized phage infection (PIP) family protein YhgE